MAIRLIHYVATLSDAARKEAWRHVFMLDTLCHDMERKTDRVIGDVRIPIPRAWETWGGELWR